MPYSSEHKQQTNNRIVESARRLFNTRGFSDVSIDEIMAEAGLTRGGFYNHFRAKEDLYAEILHHFLREQVARVGTSSGSSQELARMIVEGYISRQHLSDTDNQCPLMALPSDVARAGEKARSAYQQVLEAMIKMFEQSLDSNNHRQVRETSLAITAVCVGAMVLARTIDDNELTDEICTAARSAAFKMIENPSP